MGIEVFNRYENKYLVDEKTYHHIYNRLLEYMELDEFNKKNEFYTISNIYYDTKDNQLIRRSLSKPKYKEKLRLRAYGVPNPDAQVYLEIKKKYCGLVNKRRTNMKLDEAYDFVSSKTKPEIKHYMNKQVINEIEYIWETTGNEGFQSRPNGPGRKGEFQNGEAPMIPQNPNGNDK